jgi:CheY-like chemotaxis protein
MSGSILALESDKKDIYQLRLAFQSAGLTDRLTVVRNREEALCYLKGVGVYGDRHAYPLPNLVLLDITADICDGIGILKWIKEHPQLKTTIIVATGREMPQRLAQNVYDLGANAVFEKPNDLLELSELIRSLEFLPGLPEINQSRRN